MPSSPLRTARNQTRPPRQSEHRASMGPTIGIRQRSILPRLGDIRRLENIMVVSLEGITRRNDKGK